MLRERHFSRVLRNRLKPVDTEQKKAGGSPQVTAFVNPGRGFGLLLETRPGTAKVVSELGGLSELVLDLATIRHRVVKLLAGKGALKQDNLGDRVWGFDWRAVKLVGDANGDLHIAGFFRSLPTGLQRGRSYFLGAVVRLTIRNARGEQSPHRFAPHGGEYPRLYYRDGFLFFRGGTYSITGQGLDG